jgi:exodeoxyribonuclease VII large subunit
VTLVTVSEITAYLKELFQIDPVLADIWVRGEASNISRPASGHLYFSLKDIDASLRCVCFKQQARYLSYLPDDGDAVLAHGRIGIYEATGQYQLYIDLIQPDGVGLLAAQFERLRLQLEREGLFDEARKRPLPAAPRCIGVVTSASGAVWHDIQTVVARRYPLTSLVLAPASVQGSAAPAEIVQSIAELQADGRADVIIVGRGGGVARSVSASRTARSARRQPESWRTHERRGTPRRDGRTLVRGSL